MQFIIYLIQKYKSFLLFFVLELIAFSLTVQLHSFQKSKIINSANSITGGVYNNILSFRDYIHLKEENEILNKENEELKNALIDQTKLFEKHQLDTSSVKNKYNYTAATIINNDFHKRNNFITLNKGSHNGIAPDMGVVNSKGIVGVVSKTSENYAVAISVLNRFFRTNAKFKKNDYFGTISWDGKEQNVLQLQDIPRQANVVVGDTLVTGGKSSIFPRDILIGKVRNIEYHNNRYYRINIQLFNNLRNISQVYIIESLDKKEIKKLESEAHE